MTNEYRVFPDADILTLDGRLMIHEERLEFERCIDGNQLFEGDEGLVWDVTHANQIVAGREPEIKTPTDQPVSRGLNRKQVSQTDPSLPGIVVENDDGTILPIDGNHRYAKAKELRLELFYFHILTTV